MRVWWPGSPPPLVAAARAGHLETARRLLDHQADPNQADGDYHSPLYHAAANVLRLWLRGRA